MPTVEEFIESCQYKLIDLSKRTGLMQLNASASATSIFLDTAKEREGDSQMRIAYLGDS